jgi:hypothetical protein
MPATTGLAVDKTKPPASDGNASSSSCLYTTSCRFDRSLTQASKQVGRFTRRCRLKWCRNGEVIRRRLSTHEGEEWTWIRAVLKSMVRRKAESHVGRVPIAIRDKILDIILIARDKIRCPPRPPWRSGSLLFSAHAVGCARPSCNPTYFLPTDCTQARQVKMLKTRNASRRPSSACHNVNLHNAHSDTHTQPAPLHAG